MNKLLLLSTIIGCMLLHACGETTTEAPPATTVTTEEESSRLNQWFQDKFDRNIGANPEMQTYIGLKDRQHELTDESEEHALKKLEWAKQDMEELQGFDTTLLDEQTLLSYRLKKMELEQKIKYEKYRHYNYPVNQMHGIQAELPAFMLGMHQVGDEEDALAYISRLNAFTTKFNQVVDNLKIREAKGIVPPKFVFPHLYNDCNNIINAGNPTSENLFVKDLREKLAELSNIHPERQEALLNDAMLAVDSAVVPAYQHLLNYLQTLEQKATTDDGVWKFDDGSNFYKYRLEKITTTNMTADEIFETGKAEVARIHNEMEAIMQKVGFKGDLKAFFTFMQNDPQFYYPATDEGRQQLLAGYQSIVDSMESRLDEVFYTRPKARMQVKAVEPFREKSAGKAFYQRPAQDGSRPGTFYANLYKMKDMPTYEMEALAYHEGIPGHHMQGSIAQELTEIPQFRKYSGYTAYSEGWGLYCEYFPKEMGFYADPYSDFGRLSMELWRACRLVVDVGIHEKRWTREEAIQFLLDNTPNTESSCTKAIERYIVMPGQATAYKVGMLKILELREKAKTALGDQFDVRAFHDIFLRSGGVPLQIFEERINQWIKSTQQTE